MKISEYVVKVVTNPRTSTRNDAEVEAFMKSPRFLLLWRRLNEAVDDFNRGEDYMAEVIEEL